MADPTDGNTAVPLASDPGSVYDAAAARGAAAAALGPVVMNGRAKLKELLRKMGRDDERQEVVGDPAREQTETSSEAALAGPDHPSVDHHSPDEGEGTIVVFDEAFGAVLAVKPGERIPDPIGALSEDEQIDYRQGLADVVKAQRYAETLGAVPRRK